MSEDKKFEEVLDLSKREMWRCTGTNCPVTSENYLVAEHSPECEAEMNQAEEWYDDYIDDRNRI